MNRVKNVTLGCFSLTILMTFSSLISMEGTYEKLERGKIDSENLPLSLGFEEVQESTHEQSTQEDFGKNITQLKYSEEDSENLFNELSNDKDFYKIPSLILGIRYSVRLQCKCTEVAPATEPDSLSDDFLSHCMLYRKLIGRLKEIQESQEKMLGYYIKHLSDCESLSDLEEIKQRAGDIAQLAEITKKFLRKKPAAIECIFSVTDLENHVKQRIAFLQNVQERKSHLLKNQEFKKAISENMICLESIQALRDRIELYNHALLNP